MLQGTCSVLTCCCLASQLLMSCTTVRACQNQLFSAIARGHIKWVAGSDLDLASIHLDVWSLREGSFLENKVSINVLLTADHRSLVSYAVRFC